MFEAQSRWANRPATLPPVLIGGDIILSPSRRVVLIKDTEVVLQKKEFAILQLLMANKGHFMEPGQLLRKVWDSDYMEADNKNLYKTINRLRNKISEVSPNKEYIKVEREIGYKFIE